MGLSSTGDCAPNDNCTLITPSAAACCVVAVAAAVVAGAGAGAAEDEEGVPVAAKEDEGVVCACSPRLAANLAASRSLAVKGSVGAGEGTAAVGTDAGAGTGTGAGVGAGADDGVPAVVACCRPTSARKLSMWLRMSGMALSLMRCSLAKASARTCGSSPGLTIISPLRPSLPKCISKIIGAAMSLLLARRACLDFAPLADGSSALALPEAQRLPQLARRRDLGPEARARRGV